MNPNELVLRLTRRSFLGRATTGIGSLALASLHQDARDYEEAVSLYRETQDVVR